MRRSISFRASGEPVPQGSMKAFVRNGRAAITHVSTKDLTRWRRLISRQALAAMEEEDVEVTEAAVSIYVDFFVKRPASRTNDLYPIRRKDLDKMVRAVGDALTGVVYRDDVQIVQITARKSYAKPDDEHALITVSFEEEVQP